MPIPGMLIVILKWASGWWKLWCINKLYLLLYWNGLLDDDSMFSTYLYNGCDLESQGSLQDTVACGAHQDHGSLTLAQHTHWAVLLRHLAETEIMLTSSNGNFFRVTGPVTGEFHAQRPVTWSFDVFFDLRLNKRLSKQSRGWRFETPSRSLWCHYNGKMMHFRMQYHRSTAKEMYIQYISNGLVSINFCVQTLNHQYVPLLYWSIASIWEWTFWCQLIVRENGLIW